MRAPFLAALIAATAFVLTACSSGSAGTPATAPTTVAAVPAAAPSADQTLVTELNVIKAKYPTDTTPKVTLVSLPTFVRVACSIVSGGLGPSPEWQDIATELAKTKRCTP